LSEKVRNARHSPLIEGDTAIFIHRGRARKVELVGDFTGWRPRRLRMRKVRNEDLRYYVAHFPAETRVEYKLIANGRWINDPLNPRRVSNGLGGINNFVAMPGYRPATIDHANFPPPRIETLNISSGILGGTRRVKIYLPPGYDSTGERFTVLYLQDGSEYLAEAQAAQIAQQLILTGQLHPFIMVFVDPRNRMTEYWANDRFADFLGLELVPAIDQAFRTKAHRDGRALLGASLGGVASVWTALRQPHLFARVGGQSSAFWIDRERVTRSLGYLPGPSELPFRFYFDVGRIEGATTNRRVRDVLIGKGYDVTYREAWTGHNWTSWRDRLPDAFQSLWAN
jgi:enterochelin esterase family protein